MLVFSQNDDVKSLLLKEGSRGSTVYKSAALTYLAETKPIFSIVVTTIKESVAIDDKKIQEAAISLIGKSVIAGDSINNIIPYCFKE